VLHCGKCLKPFITSPRLTIPRSGCFLPENKVAPRKTTKGRHAALGKSAAGGGNKMSDLNQRIEAMYQSDRRGAWALIALLWIVVLFVLFMSWPYIPDSGVKLVVAVAALAVLIFNTASIMAMLKNYTNDKHFIYGLDIKMLDETKKNG
jgi:hypothetical protein